MHLFWMLTNFSPLPVTFPSPIQNSSKPIANTTAVTSKIEPISLEDKEVDEFVDLKNKEKISNEIRAKSRRKGFVIFDRYSIFIVTITQLN